MQIVHARPPNYDEILAVFPGASHSSVVFCYGSVIYSPGGIVIPPQIIRHEEVHSGQHREIGGPELWWKRYLVDVEWRAAQELVAHGVEYKAFCEVNRDRNAQARMRVLIAQRMSGPLYGNVLSYSDALKAIR